MVRRAAGAGVPLMAAGGGAGVVTVWNLEERRLATVIRDAHDAPLVPLSGIPMRSCAACIAYTSMRVHIRAYFAI